jgi:hypothetical protein
MPRCRRKKAPERQKIGVGVGIGIGGEKGIGLAFGHEKLDVYRAAMLTKLGQRGYAVYDGSAEYRTERIDPDTDTDPDPERKPRPPTTRWRRRDIRQLI